MKHPHNRPQTDLAFPRLLSSISGLRIFACLVLFSALTACGGGTLIHSPGHGQTFRYSNSRAVTRSRIQLYVASVHPERDEPAKVVEWFGSNDGATWVDLGVGNPLSIDASDLASKLGVDLPHGYWTTVMIRAQAEDEAGRSHVESVAIKLVHHPELD